MQLFPEIVVYAGQVERQLPFNNLYAEAQVSQRRVSLLQREQFSEQMGSQICSIKFG
jgi:hypothetical protein